MRILHTADWHLGHAREKIDRLEEQREVVREICAVARSEKVDLVLVAGDIYDTFNPSAAAERIFFSALDELAEEGRRGIVVIAGNHDSPERLSAVRPLAERLGISLLGAPRDELSVCWRGEPAKVRRVASGPSWLETTPLPDLPGAAGHPGVEKLPIDETFRRFFLKNQGAEPDASLVRLFMELAAPPERRSTDLFVVPAAAKELTDEPLFK
jgi:exonuclease SbcD